MLKMTEKSRRFMEKWLPNVSLDQGLRPVLRELYELIDIKGFNEKDEYNAFGEEAQEVYDDIYYTNHKE